MISKHQETGEENLPEGDLEDRDYNPEDHEFISHLVAAKARVTPLKAGLSIPKIRTIRTSSLHQASI